jgi:hypothetical protein
MLPFVSLFPAPSAAVMQSSQEIYLSKKCVTVSCKVIYHQGSLRIPTELCIADLLKFCRSHLMTHF